ncbi:MAG: DnaJ domain-containing protein, partial [Pseudoxanthomonas sp.]|nr:DnaJ domain-containing protein [Pseudoxanthomonas sp.]
MRNMLREQPLPPDTGELLTLVAGSPEAVVVAARNCGEAPATVQEAACFFVQEVMLFPGADAYRLLGAQRGADDALLKAHYRALQSWLHPDRRGNDLKSTYAARINSAWGRLRTPERRRAYDAMLDGERAPSSSMAQAQGPAQVLVRVQGWDAQAERSPPWKIIVPVMAILTLCVLLGWKVSRDTATRAGPELWSRAPVEGATEKDQMALITVPSLSARAGEATAVSATPSLPLDEAADPPVPAIADSLPLRFPPFPSPAAPTTTQAAASLAATAVDPSFSGTLPPADDPDPEPQP